MAEQAEDRSRVVVKFNDDVALPYEDGVEGFIQAHDVGPWHQLFAQFPGATIMRLFTTVEPAQIRELASQVQELDQDYHPPNFLTYFAIDCPPDMDAPALAKTLATWFRVQTAYVEGGPAPPPTVKATDDPKYGQQVYLNPAPTGIDAASAWQLKGGDGAGIDFIDIEQGWTLDHQGLVNHQDLAGAHIQLLSGRNHGHFGHGTAVLGIIAAVDNKRGGIGIAPRASGRLVSQYRPTGDFNTADAICCAVTALKPGDVLLLETQTRMDWLPSETEVDSFCATEVEHAPFDLILAGTKKGIVVVEAAGNGAQDLDLYEDAAGHRILKRGDPHFRDSGAIMVGAAKSTDPHARHPSSNYGSRIDCYSWGEDIFTTGGGFANSTTAYTSDFGETSGASAIIAGAAMVVEGVAQAKNGSRLSPKKLRNLLRSSANGTKSAAPGDKIGVMPDLKKIVEKI